MSNSADPDQLAYEISWLLQKPTDLDLHCFKGRVYPGSAGQGLTHTIITYTMTAKDPRFHNMWFGAKVAIDHNMWFGLSPQAVFLLTIPR